MNRLSMQFEADFYDGISPRAKRVLVTIDDEHFLFTVASANADEILVTQTFNFPINTCIVQAKLGGGKRLIDLPDDSRLETDFKDLERYLPAKSSNTFWQLVHYAETHKLVIALAFIGIAASSLGMLQFGVPMLAKYAAIVTPASVENDLGKQTL